MYAIRSYYATEILKKLGCSDSFIKQVCEIIRTHHDHPANPTEPFKILYDADKIVMFTQEEYPTYNSREDFNWNKIINLIYTEKEQDLAKNRITSYNVCYTKLLRAHKIF